MFNLPETNKQYYRYFSLLAVIILGVVSIVGSGGGGDSAPPPPTGPSVDVFPSQSSKTALVTTNVLAIFSEPMQASTINTSSFLLSDSGFGINSIAGTITYHNQIGDRNNIAIFEPVTDLEVGMEYFATITTDVKDLSGESLPSNYNWSFYIAPALVAVSTDSAGGFVNGDSDDSAINETGEYIVFASLNEFVPGYSPGTNNTQIYRKNTVTDRIELVSITKENPTTANGPCSSPRISDTGRFVVFASEANNLDSTITVPDPVGVSHIYLKDMKEGTVTLLDRHPTALPDRPGNGPSDYPDISGNPLEDPQGIYVVFESLASDLVSGDSDTNGVSDIIFIHPIQSGNLERARISVRYEPDLGGDSSANGPSSRPTISDDGTLIAFEADATDLINEPDNGNTDIFLVDRSNFPNLTTTRVSLSYDSSSEDGPSTHADISTDGKFIVFQSAATKLVSGDSNGIIDVFLRNLVNSTTTRMSVAADGSQATGCLGCIGSTNAVISADGSYVAFGSDAPNLVSGDTNGENDIFVRHTQYPDSIARVSVDNSDSEGNGPSTQAAISADGNYISFTTGNKFDTDDYITTDDIYRAYNAAIPLTP